jgi:hypothetical protein
MRTLILVGTVLLAVPSFARDRSHGRTPPRTTVAVKVAQVDDEPVHEVAVEKGLDTGQLREAQIAAPSVGDVATQGSMIDKGPQSDDPAATRVQTSEPVSGVNIEELAARQMRKYQRAIDGCLAEVHKKSPASVGSIDLVISVANHKVAGVQITDDSLKNAKLNACLTKSARTWSFSLPDAQFTKTILLSPQASR